jgi:hypothetical protein
MTRQIAPAALIALDFLGLPFHDSFHGQAVDSRWRPQQPGPASASGQGRGRDESQSGRWLPSAASWLFRVVDVGLSAHGIGGTAAHQRVQRGNSASRSAPAVAASLESGPDHPDQGDGGRERMMRGPSPSLRSCASTRAGPRSGTSATVCGASPGTTPTPTCTPRTPTPTRSSHTWQPTADRATALPTDRLSRILDGRLGPASGCQQVGVLDWRQAIVKSTQPVVRVTHGRTVGEVLCTRRPS